MINTDALTARAVNIDSRLRVRGEAADCVVQLEEPVHLPRNSVCWLTAASIPYVWPLVSEDVNNKLYITERNELFATTYPYQLVTHHQTYVVPLTEFNYANTTELAQAVKLGLNTLKSGKILDDKATYEVAVNASDETKLDISILHNGAPERYDLTGTYSRSDSLDKLWVLRDNRYRLASTSLGFEYVAAGMYDFTGVQVHAGMGAVYTWATDTPFTPFGTYAVSISNVVYQASPSATPQIISVLLENQANSAAANMSLLRAQISFTSNGSLQTVTQDANYDGATRKLTIFTPIGGLSQTLTLTMLSDPDMTGAFSFTAGGPEGKTIFIIERSTVEEKDVSNERFSYEGVVYTKDAPLVSLPPPYAFALPPQISLNVTTPNSQSIHEVLGHFTDDDPARNGFKTTLLENGIFQSTPNFSRLGQAIYVCSSTLSGHAGLLPSGYNTALARIPLSEYGETIDYQESLDKNYIDSGGLIIRSINLSLRDHSGNVLPLGENNWSAQLVFGYPE